MFLKVLNRTRPLVAASVPMFEDRLRSWTKPPRTALTRGCIHDLAHSKAQLVIENAVLRQHLIVLHRSIDRPGLIRADRALLVLLASRLQRWKAALLIKPETILRWHR